MYRSSDSKSLNDVLLGLALAWLTPIPKTLPALEGLVCPLSSSGGLSHRRPKLSHLLRPGPTLFKKMLPTLSPPVTLPAYV